MRAHEDSITGVYFDGRKDFTLVLNYDENTGRYHKRMIKDKHISVTSEPEGLYRFHYTPAEAITPSTPSREIALVLYEWMVEHNKDKSIIVLGGDSTNSMSGYKGGAIAWVEKMLDRKVF